MMRDMAFSWAVNNNQQEEYREFMGDEEGEAVFAAIGRHYADVGEAFIVIASRVLGRDIIVVTEGGRIAEARRATNEFEHDEPIYVHFNGHNHYGALVPVPQ